MAKSKQPTSEFWERLAKTCGDLKKISKLKENPGEVPLNYLELELEDSPDLKEEMLGAIQLPYNEFVDARYSKLLDNFKDQIIEAGVCP